MSDFVIYIAVIVAIVTAIVIYFRRHFTYWSRNGVPGLNFIDINEFLYEHHAHILNSAQKYGPIYGLYKFFGKGIVVNDPDLIHDIMVKDFHLFTDREDLNLGKTLIGLSLFFLPGNDRWKRIRSIISPSFTSGKLKSMVSHMQDIGDNFVSNIAKVANKDEAIDLREYIGAFAMDVICACAYGVNPDSINNANHPIVVKAKNVLGKSANISVILSVLLPNLARWLNLDPFDVKAVNYFEELTNKIVEERKKISFKGNTKAKKSDFIQLMIDTEKQDVIETMSDDESMETLGHSKETNAENNNTNNLLKNERTLSTEELTAQGILFFVAGYDTTSAALTHCFNFLSQNQECQQKLYEELLTAPDFKYETLNKLKYLNAVIHETLRLCPSLNTTLLLRIDRTSIKDYKLGNTGITIPAKTTVCFLPIVVHRDPRYFSDPDQFKPERFINPTHNPRAYIPFGGGQRSCIGMRFALNEMRVCVAKLVTHFKFEPKPDFKLTYYTGNILYSPKKLMVYIKSRN